MKVSGLKAMLKNRRNRENIYGQAEFWDAKVEEYAGTAVSGWANQTLNTLYHDKELELLHACFPRLAGLSVLDIGCGTGRMSRHLSACQADVLGIDFSARAIAIARRESPTGNPAYRVQSVTELSDKGRFDAALSFGCLSVACNDRWQLAAALASILAALKPGGRLLLIEPIHRGLLHLALDMDVHTFRAVMGEVGFEMEKVVSLHFWPIVRPIAYFDLPAFLTVASYRLGDRILPLLRSTYFGDYKAIVAARPK